MMMMMIDDNCDHVPMDVDFPSEEHSGITCHGGSGVMPKYLQN